MELEQVTIRDYKCLRDVTVDFTGQTRESDGFSAHLLVGGNGSGKTCFLEAVGLIFSRIMQGEVPGFPFVLQYRVGKQGHRVRVTPAKKNATGRLSVSINGEPSRVRKIIQEEYLPKRIISCSSGANHAMDSVLLRSPRSSLVSDLFDAVDSAGFKQKEELDRLLGQYQSLDTAPRMFSVNTNNAELILPTLFAVIPDFRDKGKAQKYLELRNDLVGRIGGNMQPVALSLTIDETLLRDALSERASNPQYGLLERLFREETADGERSIHDWVVQRQLIPSEADNFKFSDERVSRTAAFLLEPWENGSAWMWNPRLSELFSGDPMQMFSVLSMAQRSGILRNVQLAFRTGNCNTLLGMDALSDGELMWLSRMGLVLMSRTEHSSDTLFLMDEPDVHFNDEWNARLMQSLRSYGTMEREGFSQEFLIATHSTLMLTDTWREQVHLFTGENGFTKVSAPPISPFAAGQDEVSAQIFKAGPIGSYAKKTVNDVLKDPGQSVEGLMQIIHRLGPGYPRFQLYEKYYDLLKTER